MRLLLDTQILLWAATSSSRLRPESVGVLTDPANHLFFSLVSIWEVAIKSAFKKDMFDIDPAELRRALLEAGMHELGITASHIVRTTALPLIHRDPFDRLMVAQAAVEDLVLMTADSVVVRYPVTTLRA